MKGLLRRILNRIQPPRTVPLFLTAPSIQRQEVTFQFRGRTLKVEADHRTPLYETVGEVVDFDCYQLSQLPEPAQGAIIIDIGANVGVTALCLAQFDGARIVCLEPLQENETFLRVNLARNCVSRVSILGSALGETDGVAQLIIPEETVGCRLALDAPLPAGSRSAEVKTISLRTLLASCEGEVFLVKADCEGGEYSLVSQMTEAMALRVRYMTFEVHDIDERRNLRTMVERLESLGYSLAYKPDCFGRSSLHHLFAAQSRLTGKPGG